MRAHGSTLTAATPCTHLYRPCARPPTPPTSPTQAIDAFRPTHRLLERPLRLPVSDVARAGKGGVTVGGKLEGGALRPGARVLIMPSCQAATVKCAGEWGLGTAPQAQGGIGPQVKGSLYFSAWRGLHSIHPTPPHPPRRSLEVDGKPASLARAGDSADVTLGGVEASAVGAGSVLCHPDFPVPLVDR